MAIRSGLNSIVEICTLKLPGLLAGSMLNNPFGVSGHTLVHSSATETFRRHLEIRYEQVLTQWRISTQFCTRSLPIQFRSLKISV